MNAIPWPPRLRRLNFCGTLARRYERWRLTRRIRAFERYCERLQAEREERWYSIAWLRSRIQDARASLAELERLP